MAQILTLPAELRGLHPWFAKTTGDLFWSSGILVALDADIIVTSPLDDLTEQAAAGRIAVNPDHDMTRERQFPEWVTTFELRDPLRPQRYVHAGAFALSLDHWPHLLKRWRRACFSLPAEWPGQGFLGPFGLGDQDALNALLMSEVPQEAIWIGSEGSTVHADAFREVEVVDARSLTCRYRGGTPVVLHYGLSPKAWEPSGWRRVRADDAYLLLLRRLFFGRDARVRIESREVPIWLRPRGIGRAAASVIGAVNFVRFDLRHKAMVFRNRLFRRE